MREVLDTLHRIAAQLPEPRELCWVAVILIEAAIETLETLKALPDTRKSEWLARVKPVCSRIDFVLRDLAVRSDADTSVACRDMLYAIATADAPTPRMREIRACFQLDDLLPASPSADDGAAATLKPALDEARKRLDNLKDTWSEYTAGETNRLAACRT